MQGQTSSSKRIIVDEQNYYKMANTNLEKKNNNDTIGKVAKEFTKVQASEAPPRGPPTGASPGRDPVVEGTNEDLGANVPRPSDWGAGDGANIESLITDEGGAMSRGNCCAPALSFEMQYKEQIMSRQFKINTKKQLNESSQQLTKPTNSPTKVVF